MLWKFKVRHFCLISKHCSSVQKLGIEQRINLIPKHDPLQLEQIAFCIRRKNLLFRFKKFMSCSWIGKNCSWMFTRVANIITRNDPDHKRILISENCWQQSCTTFKKSWCEHNCGKSVIQLVLALAIASSAIQVQLLDYWV